MPGKVAIASESRRQSLPSIKPSSKEAPESAFSRFVVGPIIFITFVLSLAQIDRKAAERIFGREQRSKNEYYHSHQKKLGKQGMVDAFHIQGRVIIVFCLLSGMALAVAAFGASRLWQLVFYRE